MNIKRQVATLLLGVVVITSYVQAQFNNPGGNGWWRTNQTGANLARGLAIGNLTTTPFPAAFQVHGDLTATLTGEVFRTNAGTSILGAPSTTYWRMFHGGTGAGDERGQLFAVPTLNHFNINSPNGHFQLHTQNVQRARLNGNVTSPIGPLPAIEFPNINRDGFFLLSGTANTFINANSRAPFTRLHLIDDAVSTTDPTVYAQQHGFRPWQRNGITFTGNSDQSYIGHRYAGNDNTDFVIQWSDNPNGSPWGTDRMKFVFTTQYNPANSRGATSVDGLEAMRLWPRSSQDVNVGIGDFFAGNQLTPATVVDPTERLDILTGRLRIRDLPNDPMAIDSFYVMVVDRTALTAANQERGVVKWVPPSVFGGGGGTDCKWTLLGTGNANIATAYPGNPGCPQYDRFVGIGTNAPSAKLHVKWTGTSGDAHAGQFQIDGSSYGKRGGEFNASGTGSVHAGLRAIASGASSSSSVEGNMGVHARAEGTVSVARNRGLFSEALVTGSSTVVANMGLEVVSDCNASTTVTENYGVRAVARTFGASTTNYGGLFSAVADDANATVYGIKASAAGGAVASRWAGWFDGNVNLQNGNLYINEVFQLSDEALKTGIEEVTPSTSVIDALQVRSYAYSNAIDPAMQLPDGQRIGLIAQEVEQLLPHLVSSVSVVPRLDSAGVAEHAGYSYKTINYVGLIPYLISAVQKLTEEHAQLRAQLAACCANTGSDPRVAPATGGAAADEPVVGQDRLLRIAPNPFTERTTLYCTLERSGRMQLLANSADGRDLRVLSEAQREAGEYQYEWDTTALAPGVYYITLLLDGEPVVKKAVKVGR